MNSYWTITNAKTDFCYHKRQWQGLCETTSRGNPLLDQDFVEPLINHFGKESLYLAINKEGARVKGMALLVKKNIFTWETFAPGPSPICLAMLTGSSPEDSMKGLIKALPSIPVLIGFNRLDPDFNTTPFHRDLPHGNSLDYITTIRHQVGNSFENYWNSRSSNLKRNIKKKLKRINKSGIKSSFEVVKSKGGMRQGVTDFGSIESAGWKGKEGTAVHINNKRGKFYADMLEKFSERGQAKIFQLFFDDKIIASALTISGNGTIIILKITYDETMSQYSPGWLMMYHIHEFIYRSQADRIIEYYGNASQLQKQWAREERTMFHYNYFWPRGAQQAFEIIKTLKRSASFNSKK